MFRMVGGTFGVAALGALVAAVGRHDLEQSLPQRPRGRRATRSSTGSAPAPALGGAPPQVVERRPRGVRRRARHGLTISAIAVAAGAVLAWLLIAPGRAPGRARSVPPEPSRDGSPRPEAELVAGSGAASADHG